VTWLESHWIPAFAGMTMAMECAIGNSAVVLAKAGTSVPVPKGRTTRPTYQVLLPQVRTPASVIDRLPSPACGVPVTGVAVSVKVVAVAATE